MVKRLPDSFPSQRPTPKFVVSTNTNINKTRRIKKTCNIQGRMSKNNQLFRLITVSWQFSQIALQKFIIIFLRFRSLLSVLMDLIPVNTKFLGRIEMKKNKILKTLHLCMIFPQRRLGTSNLHNPLLETQETILQTMLELI